MISIIDYDMGNLRSVQKGFENFGAEAKIIRHPEDIAAADKLVLPGVGAFRDAMTALRERDMVEPIREFCRQDRPFLGICLGLQLLFDKSYEDGEYDGLGIVPGEVVRFQNQPGLKIPHMGWNELIIERETPLLSTLASGDHVYFVHSYHVVPTNPDVVAARTQHGETVVAVIQRGNLYATQFHPEKSQAVGQTILQNFADHA